MNRDEIINKEEEDEYEYEERDTPNKNYFKSPPKYELT